MPLKDLFTKRKVQALAKNDDKGSETVAIEVRSGFKDFVQNDTMRILRVLPGTPVECQVSFGQHRATVEFQKGPAPERGNIYRILLVESKS